jgi:serralysin
MKKIFSIAVGLISIITSATAQKGVQMPKPPRHGCTTEMGQRMFRGIDTTESRGMAMNEVMWENGDAILVKFMPGSSQFLRSRIMQYAKEWEQYANIKFQFVPENTPLTQMRVFLGNGCPHQSTIGTLCNRSPQIQPTLYLDTADFLNMDYYLDDLKKGGPFYTRMVAKGTDFKNYTYAQLYADILGENNIVWNFTWMRGTTLHEFGHALGLLHEQSYPGVIKWNRSDSVYNYYLTNNKTWTRETVDFNVFEVADAYYTNGTKYDPKSIMHYSVEPWQTTNGYSLPSNNELSVGDKTLIAALYPKDKKISPLLVPKVDVVNFTKLEVVKNAGKKGLSIYPTFDVRTNAKLARVYFVARMTYEKDGKYYYMYSKTDKFNWGGFVATNTQMNLLPNSKVSYNRGKKDLELFLPYSQIEDIGNSKVKIEFFVATEDIKTGKLDRIMYYTSSNPLSLSK